ncbi:GGDEF domain-containing protein [Rheinheimera baltica]|uniref:GGDEF domain-containing protein n=1 Tax=Rheinheimera baltica TaxID=67576 RepID=UPI000406743B|nr:GGDEF domain-containing protein [Rheinheimera baltica]
MHLNIAKQVMPLQNDTKQQLTNALRARKALEDTYEAQFKILALFVSRLSLVCKGVDVELDNRLAKLRTELSRGTDLEKLLPFIEGTSESLKQLETKQHLEMQRVQKGLTQAGKLLQQQKGLPDQLRRSLRELLGKVEAPSATVHAFLPHLTDLTTLYQHALQAKQLLASENTDDDRYGHICRQISVKLTNLISELAFAEDSAVEMDNIRLSLLDKLPIDALLEACLKTISIIINSINSERQSAEQFLLKLNDALSSVQQSVVSSLTTSSELKQKMQVLNQQIEQQIEHLSEASEKATSLEQLKALVGDKLSAITGSLREKELLEQQERQSLLATLGDMERRLNQLETEASTFKKRISDQNFRSLQDALTEIPNRAAFDERYQLEIKRWQRYKKPLCVVLGDVDHFKNINDSYGHSAGDKTLKVIAKTLKNSLRETDFIARYGGEEFIILFPETSLSELTEPLNALREKIGKIPFKFKNVSVPITISFGGTQFDIKDTNRSAFDRADEALYEAKKAGRDKVILK